jgi:hypothetical protein
LKQQAVLSHKNPAHIGHPVFARVAARDVANRDGTLALLSEMSMQSIKSIAGDSGNTNHVPVHQYSTEIVNLGSMANNSSPVEGLNAAFVQPWFAEPLKRCRRT